MAIADLYISEGHVYKNGTLVKEDLWIYQGKFCPPQIEAKKVIQGKGLVVLPGLIDLQINGGWGIDFTSNLRQLPEVAHHLLSAGVTSFLPTIVSSPLSAYPSLFTTFTNLKYSKPHAHVLGLHLEGPFLAPSYAGAHEKNFICPITYDNINTYLHPTVRMVTFAPEIKDATLLAKAAKMQLITLSIGHTEAHLDDIPLDILTNIDSVTHLFNRMPPLSHKYSSLICHVLTEKIWFYSLITDDQHLNSSIFRLCSSLGLQKAYLVSDANASLNMQEGTYFLGKHLIVKKENKCYLEDTSTLAGSSFSLWDALWYLSKSLKKSPIELIDLATLHPAQLMKIDTYKGKIATGFDADFILCDENLNIKATYIKGKKGYGALKN